MVDNNQAKISTQMDYPISSNSSMVDNNELERWMDGYLDKFKFLYGR